MLNTQLFYFFFHLSSTPIGATLSYFFAVVLPYLILVLAVVFFIIRFRHAIFSKRPLVDAGRYIREACFVLLTTIGGWCIATILKYLFHTDRPFIALPDITALFQAANYSFPSGHATTFAALACGMYLLDRKWGIGFIVAAVLIGLARVAVGVHYPQDVLVGFAIGIAIALTLKYFFLEKTSTRD